MKPKTGILQRSLVVIPPGESSKSRTNWWKRLDRVVEQHPEWATEPLERGPTPISKGWRASL
jgi:hypothetical protein